jgi:von Willebrand factor type A domain
VSLRLQLRRGVLAGASALALVVSSCGVADRPPANGTLSRPDAGVDSGTEIFTPTAPTKLSCNLGPDGGVCACVDQPLLGDPPNLYFVLDRSASMQDDGKWRTVVTVLGSLVVSLGPRANVGAAVFPDPQANGCAPGIEVAPLRRGDAPAGTAGPTATALLTELGGLMANGGTPTAMTLDNLAPMLASLPGKTYVILATDGGPNCNSTANCGVDECELNIESTSASCTPGGSTDCCTDSRFGSPLSCLDSDPTIAAVTAIASSGVPVFVIGVPGSAPYAALLDQLAFAGGTPRATAPNYYAVNSTDVADLTAAMFSIAASITGTCTLTLDQTPPDPTIVNVFLGEQVLPQAGPDGWTLSGQTVTILGASCEAIETGAVLDVRVVAGCPTFSP